MLMCACVWSVVGLWLHTAYIIELEIWEYKPCQTQEEESQENWQGEEWLFFSAMNNNMEYDQKLAS